MSYYFVCLLEFFCRWRMIMALRLVTIKFNLFNHATTTIKAL